MEVLDQKTQSILHAWKDTEHKWINHMLRGHSPMHSLRPEARIQLDDICRRFDEAMVPTTEDMTVYRGLTAPKGSLTRRLHTDSGYMATSHNRDVALRFAPASIFDRGKNTPTLLEIHVPAGSLHLPVDTMVRNIYTSHEQEIILPRNTNIRLHWRRRREGNTIVIQGTVI